MSAPKQQDSKKSLDDLPTFTRGAGGKAKRGKKSGAKSKTRKKSKNSGVSKTALRMRERDERLAKELQESSSGSDEANEASPEQVVIGLDISSSVIGVCAFWLSDEKTLQSPLEISWINLKNIKGLWLKAEKVEREFRELKERLEAKVKAGCCSQDEVSINFRVGYEEPLIRLSGGSQSSAGTITMLARFNGMVGILASQVFEDDAPEGFTVHGARKGARIKLRRGKGVKRSQKEQVFEQVKAITGSSWVVTRKKRTGEVVPRDECLDASDAWVVAAAYYYALKKHL